MKLAVATCQIKFSQHRAVKLNRTTVLMPQMLIFRSNSYTSCVIFRLNFVSPVSTPLETRCYGSRVPDAHKLLQLNARNMPYHHQLRAHIAAFQTYVLGLLKTRVGCAGKVVDL